MPAVLQADSAACRITDALRGAVRYFMKPRSAYWLTRLYLCVSVLVTVSIGFTVPSSLQQRILGEIDGGLVFLGIAGLMAFVGLLDTVVNDLLPDRFRINWTDRHRLEIFAGLMACVACLAYMNGVHGASWALAARYGADTACAAFVCVFDTAARARHVAEVHG